MMIWKHCIEAALFVDFFLTNIAKFDIKVLVGLWQLLHLLSGLASK